MISCLMILSGIIIITLVYVVLKLKRECKKLRVDIQKRAKEWEKNMYNLDSAMRWVENEHKGTSVEQFLKETGKRDIAIYGYGAIGKMLEKQLKDAGFHVACIIDKNVPWTCFGERVIRPNETIPKNDVIVVTSSYFINEVRADLKKHHVDSEIISLDEILFQM